MRVLVCLVLYALSTVKADYDDDQGILPTSSLNLTDPTTSYDQISEIVNYPIYREHVRGMQLNSEDPLHDKPEAIPTMHTLQAMPSLELEVPLETAEDVYEKHGLVEDSEKASQNMKYIPVPVAPDADIRLYEQTMPDPVAEEYNGPVPSRELQTPLFEPYYSFNPEEPRPPPYRETENLFVPALSDTLEPPKFQSVKPYNPTKVFPKKYNPRFNDFKKKKVVKPVVEIFDEPVAEDVRFYPRQRPLKLSRDPAMMEDKSESQFHNQAIQKQRQMFEETQLKKREKMMNEARKQQQFLDETVSKAFGGRQEQDTSETEISALQDGDSSYAAQEAHPASGGVAEASHGPGGERTEFRMHGQHGPHSYKFGYDTGEGKNRQFRFEERDNDGYVKGHYGYYGRDGKLQVVNYDAHPHRGFHAEGPFGKV